jgi:hypothetical protein
LIEEERTTGARDIAIWLDARRESGNHPIRFFFGSFFFPKKKEHQGL